LKLTGAQRRFLRAIEDADGYLLCRDADMRTHGALLARGLIALAYGNGEEYGDGYVFTPAGRAALEHPVESGNGS
jgi:hypothetical protein